jgi:hypothetical protein
MSVVGVVGLMQVREQGTKPQVRRARTRNINNVGISVRHYETRRKKDEVLEELKVRNELGMGSTCFK